MRLCSWLSDQLRFIQVPDFRKVLIELSQESQEHSRIQGWLVEELFNQPTLYATVLLALLAELYENLPEVGDLDKPKLV